MRQTKPESERAILISTRVRPAYKAALERLASKDNRTLSDYLRLTLEQHTAKAE